jgi:hypothetical protein
MAVLTAGRAARARTRDLLGISLPVLVVAAVLAAAIGQQLTAYGGNLTGFVQFGTDFAHTVNPPRGAIVFRHDEAKSGYDGQFYYVLARDPLLLHQSTFDELGGEVFRAWRIAYPALAYLLAAGHPGSVPLAMLMVNVLVVLVLTAGFSLHCYRRGWSTLWAVVLGLLPGLLTGTLRDLTDPLATAAMVAGLLAYASGRRRVAAALLAVAVLSREVAVLAVLAVALDASIHVWRQRKRREDARGILSNAAPVVLIPAAAFIGWQLYVAARYGGPVHTAATTPPFVTFTTDFREALNREVPSGAAWAIAYELLIVAAILAAGRSLLHGLSAQTIAAVLIALTLPIAGFGPIWGATRISLPLFALLLTIGLENRTKLNVCICTTAAGMTLLMTLAVPGVFPALG